MENISCPYIVFKAAGRMFTLNSANVLAIQEMPEIEPFPEAPAGMRGIILFHDDVSPVLDLRNALGEQSLQNEAQAFSDMLETRKQDHLRWLKVLRESVEFNTPFTLATDPHKCAFGQWYDNFESKNGMVNMHLRKIEEPHRNLHEFAHKVEHCKNGTCQNKVNGRCQNCDLQAMLNFAQEKYVDVVVSLLEEAKDIFKDSFREMALVMSLNGKLCALAVDEVLSIDELIDAEAGNSINSIANATLVSSIRKSERYPNALIVELAEEALANHFGL